MVFYDNHGRPTAYTEDDIHIYLFTGEPVAYLHEDTVYGYNGRQFGWFHDGWIRDLNGNCVFFTENATGSGPIKPVKHVCPVKCVKRVKPVKHIKRVRRIKAVKKLNWSQLSGVVFFAQQIYERGKYIVTGGEAYEGTKKEHLDCGNNPSVQCGI